MRVKIENGETGEVVSATIREAKPEELPSMHDGWRFNFNKLARAPNSQAYVLVTDEHPDVIQGCMIFEMKDKVQPYMSYLEISPGNKNKPKDYESVAGCLIAYAFRESIIKGIGDRKAWLLFDVHEDKKKDQLKLMQVYCTSYKAVRIGETTMLIKDDDGDALIAQYLKR